MGANFSQSLQPQELVEFKNLPNNTLLDTIEIPERPDNRRPTDRKFLIAFAATVVVLVPFLIYTLVYSDINRMFGYDTCGNVCGQKNTRYDQWSCTGEDMTNERYLQYDVDPSKLTEETLLLTPRHCVTDCEPGYVQILGTCFPGYDNDFGVSQVPMYLHNMAWRITLLCFLSLGVTLVMLALFRFFTSAFVWASLIVGLTLLGLLVTASWYGFSLVPAKDNTFLLILSIILTACLLILFCLMIFMYRKIQLVIVLLKESLKATFAMPHLLFIPFLTLISQLIILALLLTASAYMYQAGILTEYMRGYLVYESNAVMVFTLVFNFWVGIWALQCFLGIQYMVIAGAISKWYFAKNKDYLDNPIKTSTLNVFKFHLGSVVFGSLVITLMSIVRALLNSFMKNRNLQACGDFCLRNIEQFIKFLSKNAYIMTAMHGKPFFKSGKRAAKIILQNAVNIATINYIGDFVLFMAQFTIVLISMLLTYATLQPHDAAWAAYLIVAVVSSVIAALFFSIFETVIDTIFLCFCEDSMLNDGMARPYAMTRNLMEFVENSKKIFGDKKPF